MDRIFNRDEALGIVTSVSVAYVKREEILEYFKKFEEEKEFTKEEVMGIVKELTAGKTRRKNLYKENCPEERNRLPKKECTKERDR